MPEPDDAIEDDALELAAGGRMRTSPCDWCGSTSCSLGNTPH